jgi:hypothetical protein
VGCVQAHRRRHALELDRADLCEPDTGQGVQARASCACHSERTATSVNRPGSSEAMFASIAASRIDIPRPMR